MGVARASEEQGMPHLPGVSSPTEIQAAMAEGRTWVKAFPANSLGTAWFEAIKGPFPNLCCVATGGIDAENLEAFLSAGARAAGIGSALSDPRQLDRVLAFVAKS